MTSVEIPYSIASALPSLTVLDITNEVKRELRASGYEHGIAYLTPLDDVALVRVQERESGFFTDLEELLTRLVPQDERERERLLCLLLGPRTEQVPVRRRRALPRAVAAHPLARLRAPFPATLGPDASRLSQAGPTVAVWTRRVRFGTLRPCTGPEGTSASLRLSRSRCSR